MGKTSIEWVRGADGSKGYTWNPTAGCSHAGPGCVGCYAETFASRFSGPGRPFERVITDGRWNGNVEFLPDRLLEPLKWSDPSDVFVDSMSDLFHEKLAFADIEKVFAVMDLANWHRYIILTKRPRRAVEFMSQRVGGEGDGFTYGDRIGLVQADHVLGPNSGSRLIGRACKRRGIGKPSWPPKNVWIGTSVSTQKDMERFALPMSKCPAAVRVLSIEPIHEKIDLTWTCWYCPDCKRYMADCARADDKCVCNAGWAGIDQVIVGGASGRDTHLCNLEWIRDIVRQCRAAGKPVFVKQMGAHPYDSAPMRDVPGSLIPIDIDAPTELDIHTLTKCVAAATVALKDKRKGADPSEWPEDLRVREWIGR